MSSTNELLKSQSGKRMLSYVAPVYYQSRVAMAIFQANGVEFDELNLWMDEIKAQLFPQSATWALKYWKKCWGFNPMRLFQIRQEDKLFFQNW